MRPTKKREPKEKTYIVTWTEVHQTEVVATNRTEAEEEALNTANGGETFVEVENVQVEETDDDVENE